jgi:glycosyltransferase involved in cell wall biosynthesis
MTHVAFINDVIPVSGGAERLLVQTLLALDPGEFDRTLIVTRWDPPAAESDAGSGVLLRLEQAGVDVIGIRRRSRLDIRAWVTILRCLRRAGIDVVHSHKFGANIGAVVLGRLAGVPVVAHEHGLRHGLSRTRRLADRHVIGRLAAVVLCVSEADRHRLVTTEGLPDQKVRLIRLGIPAPEAPSIAPADARGELGLDPAGVVVVATAMLRPEKRLDILLAAVARIEPACNLTVVIVGDGPERAALEAQAALLDLGSRVRFLGARTDVARVLAAADIGVLCSDREGTPLALLEYMQAGLGIVATAVGGVPDVIRDDVEGLLVAPGAPDALARAMSRLAADRDLRQRLGDAARSRCATEFDISTLAGSLERLYRSVQA